MAWDKKYSNFGVIKITGDRVKLHYSKDNYDTISVGKEIISAVWAGDDVIIRLVDGKIRKYKSKDNYQTF
jgi:hypothetical protein